MEFSTPTDLIDAGAVLVDEYSGATWNDGGRWNTWIYELPNGTLRMVHQPTDYRNDLEITEVQKVVTEVVKYEAVK